MNSENYRNRDKKIYYSLLLFSIFPLWIVSYLPMVDLAQHVGEINFIQKFLFGHNDLYESLFETNWFTPYITGYFFNALLSLLVPMPIAIKISLSLIFISSTVLSGLILKEIGSDERLQFFTIPSLYGFSFYWGFFNFLAAVPLGLLFFLVSIYYQKSTTLKNALILAFLSVFLFFSHILILCFFSLFSLLYHWFSRAGSVIRMIKLSVPYTLPLPLIFFWIKATLNGNDGITVAKIFWVPLSDKLVVLPVYLTGISESITYHTTVFQSVILAFFFLSPYFLGAKPTRIINKRVPFFAVVLMYILAPHYAFGTYFIFQRFSGFILIFYFCCFEKNTADKQAQFWIKLVLPFIVFFPLLMTLYSFVLYEKESAGLDNLFNVMDEEQRVLSLVPHTQSDYFDMPVYLHMSGWYQSEKSGVVDFNFASFFPQPVRFKRTKVNELSDAAAWNPLKFTWELFHAEKYRYFIIRGNDESASAIFKDQINRVNFITKEGRWYLYENIWEPKIQSIKLTGIATTLP